MKRDCDVFVVDDEEVVRAAIRLVLQQEGLAVTAVADADAALAHPDLSRCKLVLCDLMLPGRSGLEVLTAARAMRPHLPIVMMTGYCTPAQEQMVNAAGATAFLAKPFDDTELLTLVWEVLSRHAHTAEEHRP